MYKFTGLLLLLIYSKFFIHHYVRTSVSGTCFFNDFFNEFIKFYCVFLVSVINGSFPPFKCYIYDRFRNSTTNNTDESHDMIDGQYGDEPTLVTCRHKSNICYAAWKIVNGTASLDKQVHVYFSIVL